MSEITKCENRLRDMIITDKKQNPVRIERILKAEIINIIRNYFEITSDDVDLSIIVNNKGFYDIQINIESRAIKLVRSFDN